MFRKKRIACSGLILFASSINYAGKSDFKASSLSPESSYFSTLHSFAVFTAGPEYTHTGRSQTLSLLSPFFNHYTDDTSYQINGLLGFGVGVEGILTEQLSWQLGLSGYFSTEGTSHGRVWQFALPEFENFVYRYSVQSKQLMATGKLLSTMAGHFHPYVSGELGAGFNRARGYSETPLIVEAVPMAPFDNHTKTSFSWGIGVGLDVDIDKTSRLGIGYQFSDLGSARLGLSPAQQSTQSLSISHLYSHQIRFQLTALI